MPQRLLKALTTPTARSTAIVYIGNFVVSVSRYLFHLILLHFLVPAAYGEFLSYLSLMYILGIPMGTISTVITKYVSEFKGKNDHDSINLFFYYLLQTYIPIAVLVGALLIVFSNPLSILFKANSLAFVILGISIFISLFQAILNSYALAFQKFILQTVIGLLGVFITIIISVGLIKIGLGATGAVLGQILGSIIPSVLIFLSLKSALIPRVITTKPRKFSLGGFMGYSFLFSLGTMSIISTDILVVRVLFDPHISGIYSALSILGRMILFGLTPLIALVLPMASHRFSSTGSAKPILIKLGLVLTLFGFIGAGIFSLFPAFIVRYLSGPAYLESAQYLPIFAFTMVFFAMSQFIISYFMATGRPKSNYLLLVATAAQPLLFYIFRNSFNLVIWSNFFLQLGLTISLTTLLFIHKS